MTNVKKITYSLIGLACLVVASFIFTCTEVPDYCSRGIRYDPDIEFCAGDNAYPFCACGSRYNPITEGCDASNILGTKCADGSYVERGHLCGGYTLTTAAAPAEGGDITIVRTSPGPNYAAGEQVTLVAQEKAGYEFAGWTGAQPSQSASITLTMDGNKPMVAMFKPTTPTLATTAFPPDGGEIERTVNGTQVTVTATADAGYKFINWEGASTSKDPTITVTVDEGKTLVAIFKADTYALTVNSNPTTGGTIFVNTTASAGTTHHDAGAQVAVQASASPGYTFTGWSGASTSTAASITVSMDNGKTLTANFQSGEGGPTPTTYTLTVNAGIGGAASPSGTSSHNANTPVQITATADSGYTFHNWIVTGGGTVANVDNASTTVTLTSNATVTANFRYADGSQPPGTFSLTINRSPDDGGRVLVDNVVSTGTTFHSPETQVNIRAEAALGYRFTEWTGAVTSTNTSLPSVNIRTNVTLTANFEYVGTYTLTVNREPAAGGRVLVNNVEVIGATTQTVGAQITVKAEANADYIFTGWSGASTATAQSVTITMTRDSTITANFLEGDGKSTFTDPRDGKSYRTVLMPDGKIWMAENLNSAGYLWGNSWCDDNDASYCTKYGRLYDWEAVMNGAGSSNANPSRVQGVCPPDWHVPSDAEWTALTNAVGEESTAGMKLKAESGWDNDGNGIDDYGFSALPGGCNTSFTGVGISGCWWSATQSGTGASSTAAWRWNMQSSRDNVQRNTMDKRSGYSIRCVRDN